METWTCVNKCSPITGKFWKRIKFIFLQCKSDQAILHQIDGSKLCFVYNVVWVTMLGNSLTDLLPVNLGEAAAYSLQ